jgi:hypothetical protein
MQERIRRDCDAALGPWSLGESEEQGQRMMMIMMMMMMMMMMVEVLMVEAMMVEVMIMVSVVLRIGMSTLLLLMDVGSVSGTSIYISDCCWFIGWRHRAHLCK